MALGQESRLAINETPFQEANDRLRHLYESGVTLGDDAEFVCECGDRQCTETIRMSLVEYEAVRREDRMLVAFGHVSYERVVGVGARYLIVEPTHT
jgi:hypothetical protein